MDAAAVLGAVLTGARLVELVLDHAEERARRKAPRKDAPAETQGPDSPEEVDTMSARAIKVTIEVFPGRTSQTLKVRASGRRGTLLLGKIRRVQYRATLLSAATEQLYVSEVLTQAQALVLS